MHSCISIPPLVYIHMLNAASNISNIYFCIHIYSLRVACRGTINVCLHIYGPPSPLKLLCFTGMCYCKRYMVHTVVQVTMIYLLISIGLFLHDTRSCISNIMYSISILLPGYHVLHSSVPVEDLGGREGEDAGDAAQQSHPGRRRQA